ncbi:MULTISPECIES: IS1 family transposase [unclassified Microcoleus]|uniref:IS1 family transposase n=1 Tax=unclassified Microcoleus TaxID=2642155 RepID=UPI00403F1334
MTIQLDQLWSFVGSQDNNQWVWLALDADSREIVGVTIGSRSRQSAFAALAMFTGRLWAMCGLLHRLLGGL